MGNLWLKRILIFFVVSAILVTTVTVAFLAGLASGFLAKAETTALSEEVITGDQEKDKIGILRLEGMILTSGPDGPLTAVGSFITANQVKRWLREIAKDADVKALVIELNSPGGSPVAADEIYQAIQALRKSGRSVVVVMEDSATSGAYFLAAAGDLIIANPSTLTGSIGVLTEITNAQELLAKIGVEIETYKSGKFKDFTSFSRERTEEEKALIQEYVDTAYDLFITRVAEGRNMEKTKVRELAEGQIYSGKKALEVGLIDKLGSIEDGVEEAKALENISAAKIVRYKTESPLDVLLGRVSTMVNPLATFAISRFTPGLQAWYLPAL